MKQKLLKRPSWPPTTGHWPLLLVAGCCLVLGSGCARTHAKTTPDVPLDTPAPPPREVEPLPEPEAPPPVPAPPEPARNQPPPRPRPATPREQPRPDQPKPESPKPETPAAEPPKAEEPARPPTTLQTTPATAEGVVERSVRATLTRAGDELKRIDYGRLNTDARTQYDTAKRFIRQADDALRSKNLVFAKNLADKAVAIADQLGGR